MAHPLALVAGCAALVWGLALLVIHAVALFRARARGASGNATTSVPAGSTVHLVRPCAGLDAALHENLCSVARARGLDTVDLSITLCVARPDDPALPTMRAACEELVRAGFRCEVVLVQPVGENQKVAQLAAVLDADHRNAIGINIDSDVDLSGLDLSQLLTPFSAPKIGGTWMPTVEANATTRGDRLSQAFLGASLHSFVLLAGLDPGTFVGKVFAVRLEALREVGGFAALADYLGEDFELACRLRAAGYKTRAVAGLARSTASGRSVEAVVDRYVRWLAVVRLQRPALLTTYPLVFSPTLLILALSAAAAWHLPLLAAAAATTSLVARLVVTVGAQRLTKTPRNLWSALGSMLAIDLLFFRTWWRAMGTDTVEWRGRTLRLGRRGKLEPTKTTTG